MQPISVVLITRDESHILGRTLAAVRDLSDDLVVADTGSTDGTPDIAAAAGARVHHLPWEGYGKTKNKALEFARHDWILFLDADEIPDRQLLDALLQLSLQDTNTVYKMRYHNFIGEKRVKYGEWKSFSKVRLFHRRQVRWDDSEIHEKLVLPAGIREETLPGFIQHYSIKNLKDYADKMSNYAELVANKYHRRGKKAGFFGLYLYPAYEFIRTYIFHLAVLDGWAGFVSSYFAAYYVFLKYHRLKELNNSKTD